MDFVGAERYILDRLEKQLSNGYFYHSLDHTVDVRNQAERIALQEGVNETERALLRLSAVYHDSGYLVDTIDHEEQSCIIVKNVLPDFGFAAAQIEKICNIIRATKVPQAPANHLEEILCDADQDYLGRDDFFEIGRRLYNELQSRDQISDENTWNRLQVVFLEQHTYFMKTSKQLRGPAKQMHLEQVRLLVQQSGAS